MERALRSATLFTRCYPALVPALIYINWIVAWVELGRYPRLMLDDPKHVGRLGPVFHWFSVWSIVLGFWVFCAALALLLIALFLPRLKEKKRIALRLATALVSIAAVYVWFGLDPGRVIEWYFD